MPLRRSFDPRPVLAAVAAACVAGVLALRLWLKWVGPLPGDRWALVHLDSMSVRQPFIDLGAFFAVIGGQPVALLTGCAVLWFVGQALGARAVAFVSLACAGVFANMLLKLISGPTPLFSEIEGPGAGLNYPSGHTVYGVVMFGSLAWLAWGRGRRDIAAVFVGLLLAMGPFRVVTDAHLVSDVVAGYLAGAAWLIAAALATGAGGVSPGVQISSRLRRAGGLWWPLWTWDVSLDWQRPSRSPRPRGPRWRSC